MPKDLPLPGTAAMTCQLRCCQALLITPWKRCSKAVSRKQSCWTKGGRLSVVAIVIIAYPPVAGSASRRLPDGGDRHREGPGAAAQEDAALVLHQQRRARQECARRSGHVPDGSQIVVDPTGVAVPTVWFLDATGAVQ